MLTIDDTAIATPTLTAFSELAVGDTYRLSGKYFVKYNTSSAFNCSDFLNTQSIPAATPVERVNANLVVSPYSA